MYYFYLNELIFFFNDQESMDFPTIREILRLINDDSVPDSEKGNKIMRLLHQAGLYEGGYEGERFYLNKEPADPSESDEKTGILPVHVFQLHLLNGILEQPVIMN